MVFVCALPMLWSMVLSVQITLIHGMLLPQRSYRCILAIMQTQTKANSNFSTENRIKCFIMMTVLDHTVSRNGWGNTPAQFLVPSREREKGEKKSWCVIKQGTLEIDAVDAWDIYHTGRRKNHYQPGMIDWCQRYESSPSCMGHRNDGVCLWNAAPITFP